MFRSWRDQMRDAISRDGAMSKFVAIGKEHHGTKRWLRLQNYSFAVKATAVPIVGAEIAKVALSMPIAFVRPDGDFQLSAMLSITSPEAARRVAANSRRWWHNSAMALNMALPNDLCKRLGVPKLAG
jgi:hypothetical protein